MSEHQYEIGRVDTVEEDSTLRALLREFHEWMRETAPGHYDPEAEFRTDERSQRRKDESWAWVARGAEDADETACGD